MYLFLSMRATHSIQFYTQNLAKKKPNTHIHTEAYMPVRRQGAHDSHLISQTRNTYMQNIHYSKQYTHNVLFALRYKI